jgi:hypothetical protein
MLQDCPHCFAKVIVTSNCICPACNKDVTLRSTHDLAAITVSASTAFPEMCHACGLPADRKTNAESWSRSEYYVDDVDEGVRVLFAVLSFLFLPVLVVIGKRGGTKAEYHAVRVQVPSCSLCEKREARIFDFLRVFFFTLPPGGSEARLCELPGRDAARESRGERVERRGRKESRGKES